MKSVLMWCKGYITPHEFSKTQLFLQIVAKSWNNWCDHYAEISDDHHAKRNNFLRFLRILFNKFPWLFFLKIFIAKRANGKNTMERIFKIHHFVVIMNRNR